MVKWLPMLRWHSSCRTATRVVQKRTRRAYDGVLSLPRSIQDCGACRRRRNMWS